MKGWIMALNDLLQAARELDRADKLRMMQFLLAELAKDEDVDLQEVEYPIWTPLGVYEAAQTLSDVLKANETA
jgi:hypothetical protein